MLPVSLPRGFCPISSLQYPTAKPIIWRSDMRNILLVLGSCALLLLQPAGVKPQNEPVKHGGKIESKYDGFNYETVMRLRKMKVNCDGIKDKFKDACVSIEVSLHCPGVQLNYVRHVMLQIVFENKDWIHFHGPEHRNL